MKEVLYQLIIQYYNYFQRRETGQLDFYYSLKNRDHVMINNFIDLIDQEWGLESVGEVFLWDYFLYSYFFFHNKKTSKGKNTVELNWICGLEGIKRYKSKDEDWRFYATDYVVSHGFSFDELRVKKKLNRHLYEFLQSKERQRFHNSQKGFLNCIEFTKGFKLTSIECLKCKFKKDCKI